MQQLTLSAKAAFAAALTHDAVLRPRSPRLWAPQRRRCCSGPEPARRARAGPPRARTGQGHRRRRLEVCARIGSGSESGRAARAQYKFIVDGDWKYAPDQPAMYDEDGNVNNVLEVQEYVPENLASLSSFDPPPSPPERCPRPPALPHLRPCVSVPHTPPCWYLHARVCNPGWAGAKLCSRSAAPVTVLVSGADSRCVTAGTERFCASCATPFTLVAAAAWVAAGGGCAVKSRAARRRCQAPCERDCSRGARSICSFLEALAYIALGSLQCTHV